MSPEEREHAKHRARARIAALKARAARLRGRVFAAAIVAFVALWAVVLAETITNQGSSAPARQETALVTGSGREAAAGEGSDSDDDEHDHDEDGDHDEDDGFDLGKFAGEVISGEALEATSGEELGEAVAGEVLELAPSTTGQS